MTATLNPSLSSFCPLLGQPIASSLWASLVISSASFPPLPYSSECRHATAVVSCIPLHPHNMAGTTNEPHTDQPCCPQGCNTWLKLHSTASQTRLHSTPGYDQQI